MSHLASGGLECEGFLGLATSRILSRHLASFSPTHNPISVSQPADSRLHRRQGGSKIAVKNRDFSETT